MGKKKLLTLKKSRKKQLSEPRGPAPAAPLSRRSSRTIIAPAAQTNYYLQLADIALVGKPVSRAGRKQTGKP